MIVETIVIKSRVTKLELVAHYSGNYNYGLETGESCYATILEHDGCEYVVCINRSYDKIYKVAEFLTEEIGFPLIVNRVTKLRTGYNIVRDSVCVSAFSRSLLSGNNCLNSSSGDNRMPPAYLLNSSDLFRTYDDVDYFDLTKRDWDSNKDKDNNKLESKNEDLKKNK